MNQGSALKHRAIRYGVTRLIIAVAGGLALSGGSLFVGEAQRRSHQTRRPSKPTASVKDRRDYSVFKHEDHRKDLQCSSCHIIPSATEPDRIAAATKPSATSSYPYHDSCFRCHKEQVYRGDRPAICTVCHTRVSPRATPRDLYSVFPSPKRSEALAREFPGYFPHAIHQSVMARNQPTMHDRTGAFRVVRTSFRVSADTAKNSDICTRCHFTDPRPTIALPIAGIQIEENLKSIGSDTFKTIPGYRDASAHDVCFNCHWDSQKPTKNECNGCHLMRSDYAARGLQIIQPTALSPNAVRWFQDWPKEMPKRISLKFRHNTHTRSPDGTSETNNHDLGCTTCHANIAQMTTLNIPKADVQISSCASCHAATSAIPVNPTVRVTLFDEMSLKAEADKKYACVACHTSIVGRERPPCSHYSVLGEPCPKTTESARR